jgi:hypothetical protein
MPVSNFKDTLKIKLIEQNGAAHKIEIVGAEKAGCIIYQSKQNGPMRVFRFAQMPMLTGSTLVFHEVKTIIIDSLD